MRVRNHYEHEDRCCYCGKLLHTNRILTSEVLAPLYGKSNPITHKFCTKLEAASFLQFEETVDRFLIED